MLLEALRDNEWTAVASTSTMLVETRIIEINPLALGNRDTFDEPNLAGVVYRIYTF